MLIEQITKDDFPRIKKNLSQSFLPEQEIIQTVAEILRDVQANGDLAVKAYTQKFDGFSPSDIQVSEDDINEAFSRVPSEFIDILEKSKRNISRFHVNQLPSSWEIEPETGQKMGQLVRPLESVALYVPGGKAAYPSSVLMNAIPAQIAGVPRIAIITPAGKDGQVNDGVLAAAKVLGIDEVYKIGGAQAVAAAAMGTNTLPSVDKIVGPGNIYVAEAKRQVYGLVDIDMIAGPSEVLVIADEYANPKWIAADLLAQGEHDERAGMILVTTSVRLAEKVAIELARQSEQLSRNKILRESLKFARAYIVETLEDAFKLSNLIAPEHLELQLDNPDSYLDKVQNAGSVFLGAFTPETLGDYMAGPNHTLPTSGAARYASPLGVYDFIKRPSYLSFSQNALEDLSNELQLFANIEGLTAHANAVKVRCS